LITVPQSAVLRTLHYFDFFDHALSLEELHEYLGVEAERVALQKTLEELVDNGNVKTVAGWYGLNKESVASRSRFKLLNLKKLRQAKRVGRFINKFPFVRGVYLSGSLSKLGVQSKDDDLDFFILTAPSRVWTAKLLLIAFKKVFLLDSEKYFCINLLMDEEQLEIGKQNRYTATEVVSLRTLTDPEGRDRFLAANAWVKEYFPNVVLPQYSAPPKRKRSVVEGLMNVFFGDRLEAWVQRKFTAHMRAHTDQKEGYYEADSHSSAYFPQSVEQRLLAHLETFEDDK
jgi:hypothetical protein